MRRFSAYFNKRAPFCILNSDLNMPRNTTTKGAPSRRSRRQAGLCPGVAFDFGVRLGPNDRLSRLPLEILTMVRTYCVLIHGESSLILVPQILANLPPVDVINVSRTCKAFRKFLFNPKASMTTVWKPVLESIEGLPPCPPDLNEPQFIALLFNFDDCQVRVFCQRFQNSHRSSLSLLLSLLGLRDKLLDKGNLYQPIF